MKSIECKLTAWQHWSAVSMFLVKFSCQITFLVDLSLGASQPKECDQKNCFTRFHLAALAQRTPLKQKQKQNSNVITSTEQRTNSILWRNFRVCCMLEIPGHLQNYLVPPDYSSPKIVGLCLKAWREIHIPTILLFFL